MVQSKGKATHKGGDIITDEEIVGAIITASAEEMPPPWQIIKGNYDKYQQALYLLAKLRGEGKVDFEYDPMSRAYSRHCIFVKLKYGDDGFAVMDNAKEVAELISHFDSFTVSETEPDEWNLSIQIYVQTKTE